MSRTYVIMLGVVGSAGPRVRDEAADLLACLKRVIVTKLGVHKQISGILDMDFC